MSLATEPDTEAQLPDRYEVVNGEVVELPPMSTYSAEVANQVRDELAAYCRTSQRGRSRNDMLFRVPLSTDPTRNRRPDVVFISYERWAADRPLPYRGDPMDAVPELVVEVASPNDEAEELLAKAYEYLEAGVRLVWLVYPRLRVVHSYESPTRPRVFTAANELVGDPVLPGFRVPMAQLFPPLIPELEPDSDEGS